MSNKIPKSVILGSGFLTGAALIAVIIYGNQSLTQEAFQKYAQNPCIQEGLIDTAKEGARLKVSHAWEYKNRCQIEAEHIVYINQREARRQSENEAFGYILNLPKKVVDFF